MIAVSMQPSTVPVARPYPGDAVLAEAVNVISLEFRPRDGPATRWRLAGSEAIPQQQQQHDWQRDVQQQQQASQL